MSLDVMKQALEVLEEVQKFMKTSEWFDTRTDALRAAIEQAQPDELIIWKSRAMSAERIIEKFMQPEQKPVFELGFGWLDDAAKYPRGTKLYDTAPRQWQGLTDDEIKAPIQRAMQYFGFDSTQYNLGGAATVGFLGLVKEIEAKLKEKNTCA